MPEAFLNVHRAEVTSLAARYRLPTVYPWRFYTEIGGLLSYGIDLPDNYRRAAISADRILILSCREYEECGRLFMFAK